MRKRFGQKTYSHLEAARRAPSRYEIASTQLLYYPEKGFSVCNATADWYRRYQQGCVTSAAREGTFADPAATTYATYVEQRSHAERHLDAVLAAARAERDATLPSSWLRILDEGVAPLRYPYHGLAMAAGYVGSMAPEGRIAIAAAFQAGDETRRVDRLAQRLFQLHTTHASLGARAGELWGSHAAWQPLRRVLEHLLVAFDWVECFTALNLVLKPALDSLALDQLAQSAQEAGDDVLASILASLAQDGVWHGAWTAALVRSLVESGAEVRTQLAASVQRWVAPADAAVESLAMLLSMDGGAAVAATARSRLLEACGLAGAER